MHVCPDTYSRCCHSGESSHAQLHLSCQSQHCHHLLHSLPAVRMTAAHAELTGMQALDLETMQEVAVKVHQLNSAWSEAKKVNFVKHALREYRIHRCCSPVQPVSCLLVG